MALRSDVHRTGSGSIPDGSIKNILQSRGCFLFGITVRCPSDRFGFDSRWVHKKYPPIKRMFFIWHYGPMSIGQVRVRIPDGSIKNILQSRGCFLFGITVRCPSDRFGFDSRWVHKKYPPIKRMFFIWHYGPMDIGQVRVRFPMGP